MHLPYSRPHEAEQTLRRHLNAHTGSQNIQSYPPQEVKNKIKNFKRTLPFFACTCGSNCLYTIAAVTMPSKIPPRKHSDQGCTLEKEGACNGIFSLASIHNIYANHPKEVSTNGDYYSTNNNNNNNNKKCWRCFLKIVTLASILRKRC